MRTISAKSLCVLFGFLVPCLGMSTRAEAGVIPWMYDSIFGYGWGGGYGGRMPYSAGYGGYGGGMPYSAGYGGSGYGGGYGMGYAPMYSAPVYSAPAMSAPIAPVGGTYKALYGPSLGYYDYGYDYGSLSVVDSGSCCTPCSACNACSACGTGECATSIQSSKPAPQPTPAVPVTPKKKKEPGVDDFSGTRPGVSTGTGGTGNTGVGFPNGGEAMPETERRPNPRPGEGAVEPDPNMKEPAVDDAPPAGNLMQMVPTDHHIVVRYVPAPQRAQVVIPVPRSMARVVRIDRATREQLVRAVAKPQQASNP